MALTLCSLSLTFAALGAEPLGAVVTAPRLIATEADKATKAAAPDTTGSLVSPDVFSTTPDDGVEAPGAGRPRGHGVYAPYLASPPLGEGDLDATALRGSLEARGFTDLSRPILRGRTYICEATGPRRERVRLLVDADSGVIIGLTVLGYDSRGN
ncbi:hypothetical protein [Azorhizobium doebereinerae]|uniref:hypothetical protein n=1 Tax=Azorhizobium doebereinerae TaxID=281091 RepID=UPI0006846439|nr:hypothetical protein [Azorhizobium doebereinerae]